MIRYFWAMRLLLVFVYFWKLFGISMLSLMCHSDYMLFSLWRRNASYTSNIGIYRSVLLISLIIFCFSYSDLFFHSLIKTGLFIQFWFVSNWFVKLKTFAHVMTFNFIQNIILVSCLFLQYINSVKVISGFPCCIWFTF